MPLKNNFNKVLLISPLCEHPRYPLYFPSENLGIGYLAAYLRSKEIGVDVLDANMLGLDSSEVVKKIVLSEYALIGIATSSFLLIREAMEIAQKIKHLNQEIHITVGGHFATFSHREILESTVCINSVVRGEGEITIYKLYHSIINKIRLDTIDGITFRRINGEIIVNNPSELIANLDSIPWPERDTLSILMQNKHPWPTQLTTSRGCYANCSFCDIRAFSGTLWRARSVTDIVDEIEYLQKNYGSNCFRFTDDEFIGPKPYGPMRAFEFANEVIKRGLKVKFMIDARAHMVEEKLFTILKEAGVIDCLIGIESGVDRILKLYNKGVSVRTNENAIRILHKLHISLNLAFIMFDPRMTFDELIQNYNFLSENKIITVDSLRSWIWPLEGTPLKKVLVQQGLVEVIGFDEFKFNFLDPKVQNVYSIIEKCSLLAFELERTIFRLKIHPQNKDLLQVINLTNLEIWDDLFKSALINQEEFDYSKYKKKFNSFNQQLHLLAKNI